MVEENLFLLHAFALGAFITFVYDWLRIFRRVMPHNNLAVSLEDIVFWVFCAIEVFLLMYRESNGSLRWFAVLGAVAGMALYGRTLSPFLVKYVSLALQKLFAVLGRVCRFLLKPVAAAWRGIKNFFRFLKKRLTATGKMLKIKNKQH